MEKQYHIWSIEHNGWWNISGRGYVKEIDRAGLYSFKEAHEIVKQANEFTKDYPKEALVEYIK